MKGHGALVCDMGGLSIQYESRFFGRLTVWFDRRGVMRYGNGNVYNGHWNNGEFEGSWCVFAIIVSSGMV